MGPIEGFEATREALQAVENRLAELSAEVKSLRRDSDRLCKVVADGNGTPSLLIRVDRIERELTRLTEAVNGAAQARGALNTANITGRWQFWATIAPGILGLLVALLKP